MDGKLMRYFRWPLVFVLLFSATAATAQLLPTIVNFGPPRNVITKNMILGGTGTGSLSTTATNYVGIGLVNTSEAQNQIPLPIAGTLTSFQARMFAALTSGSYALSVDVSSTPGSAGTSTALCTLDSTHQSCSAAVSIAASAGNVMTIISTPSSPNIARQMHYGFEYDVAAADETIIWISSSQSVGTGFVGPGTSGSTEGPNQVYLPVASITNGVKNMYVEGGASTSRSVTLNFGGSTSGLTCSLSSALQCHDTTHTATASVGTLADLATTFTTTSTIVTAAIELDTSANALSILGGNGSATRTATNYFSIGGGGNGNSTANDEFQVPMPFAGSLKSANFNLAITTPDSGTWTPQANKNGSSAIACSGITGSATTCNATGSVSYVAGDRIGATNTAASTPNTATVTWSGEFDPS